MQWVHYSTTTRENVSPARLLLCLCNLRHTDISFIFITATFLYNCTMSLQFAAYSVRKLYICACIQHWISYTVCAWRLNGLLWTLRINNIAIITNSLENVASYDKKTEQDYRLAVLKYNERIRKIQNKLKLEELALNNFLKKS